MADTTDGPGVTIDIPIRWGDMDCLGHVNNTKLFQYCESARIAYFEAIDLDRFKTRPTDGPGLVAANLNFRRQMHFPGTARVRANVVKIGNRSFTIRYRIEDANSGEEAAAGESVNVWVDYAAAQAMPLPDALVAAIVRLEENPELRSSR